MRKREAHAPPVPILLSVHRGVRSKGETMRHELGKELTRRTEKSEKREFAEKLERKGKALYMWRGGIDDPSSMMSLWLLQKTMTTST